MEKLIPVTSESQLRVGMIVVIKDARRLLSRKPMGTVKGMLLNPIDSGRWAWTYDELPMHTVLCIPERRLFRVDDGMDAEARDANRTLENVR